MTLNELITTKNEKNHVRDHNSNLKLFENLPTVHKRINEGDLPLEEVISGSNLLLSQLTTDYQEISADFGRVCGYPAVFGKYRYLFEAEGMVSRELKPRAT